MLIAHIPEKTLNVLVTNDKVDPRSVLEHLIPAKNIRRLFDIEDEPPLVSSIWQLVNDMVWIHTNRSKVVLHVVIPK